MDLYLAKTFSASRFNAIIDAVGIQAIFNTCPQYLAEGKPYVTVGPRQPSYTVLGMLSTIGLMAKNFLWPRILGGVPRPYVQVASAESLNAMQELAEMVEEGTLNVHVGAKFKMTEAREVSCCCVFEIFGLTRCRRTIGCLVAILKAKLWWK